MAGLDGIILAMVKGVLWVQGFLRSKSAMTMATSGSNLAIHFPTSPPNDTPDNDLIPCRLFPEGTCTKTHLMTEFEQKAGHSKKLCRRILSSYFLAGRDGWREM